MTKFSDDISAVWAVCASCQAKSTETVTMTSDTYLLMGGRHYTVDRPPLNLFFSGAPGWTFEFQSGRPLGLRCPKCQE